MSCRKSTNNNITRLSNSPLILQAISTTQVAISYVSTESFLLVFNPYLSTQFRIVGYRLCCIWNENNGDINSVGYTDKCYARMKKWIRQHQALIEFSSRIESVFRFNIFLYVLLVSVLMCLGAYQIVFVSATLYQILTLQLTSTRVSFVTLPPGNPEIPIDSHCNSRVTRFGSFLVKRA